MTKETKKSIKDWVVTIASILVVIALIIVVAVGIKKCSKALNSLDMDQTFNELLENNINQKMSRVIYQCLESKYTTSCCKGECSDIWLLYTSKKDQEMCESKCLAAITKEKAELIE